MRLLEKFLPFRAPDSRTDRHADTAENSSTKTINPEPLRKQLRKLLAGSIDTASSKDDRKSPTKFCPDFADLTNLS